MYLLHINKVVIHLSHSLIREESELTEAVVQKVKKTEQTQVSELDLSKIDGNGDFPCPNCGVMFSPEDETDDVYTIITEKVNNDILEELLIQCNACKCQIKLTGFSSVDLDAPLPE